jgi:seryl-tRNA synthetase
MHFFGMARLIKTVDFRSRRFAFRWKNNKKAQLPAFSKGNSSWLALSLLVALLLRGLT